jgi:2-oxoglutarate ferredoxin oxidoreductase subunit alpha
VRGTDRYDPHVPDGISPRWLPGVEAATYCAQADEHNADGTVDETSENTMLQFTKRLKKMEALKRALPEPELFGAQDPDVLLVGWGSTKGTVLDVMERMERRIGYLHYTYLWPLRTERFEKLCAKARKTILVEGNCLGQLGMLIKQQCGIEISEKILKYDGRPFFFDELLEELQQRLSQFLILNS